MAGVRVAGIPKKAEEKQIKIHFSKPQNGGGTIKKIYYPLLNNDAVIIYHDPEAVDSLLQNEYASVLGRERHQVIIQRLPEHTVFSSMQARVSPEASVLLQASPALLDEFRYNEEIDVDFDERTGTYSLSGNWYQLEWAWTYLDAFIQQQEVIQDEIKHKPFRNNASPMDVEDGGGGETGATARSALDKFGMKDARSAFYTETVTPESTPRGRMTVAQSLTESSAKFGEKTSRDTDSPDTSPREVHSLSTGGYKRLPSPASSENDDDKLDLSGTGYKIPDESIPMSLQSIGRGRKSDQENTFNQFSGLDLETDRSADKTDSFNKQRPTKTFEEDRSFTSSKSYQTETHRSLDLSPDRDENASLSRSSQRYQSLQIGKDTTSSFSRGSAISAGAETEHKSLGETYTKDHMQYRFTVRGIDVVALLGDLVKEETDAIVNPANSGLEHWGGASYAISRAAGPNLDRECRDYIVKHGHLKVAEVMHTTGGNLKALRVLHTYGPMWFESSPKDKVEFELTSTFLNCFKYADKLRLKSLCVPAISTGVFGVPLDICIRSFLDALLIFSNQRTSTNLQNIRLINKDPEAAVTSIVLLQTALEGDIETLTSQAFETFNRCKEKELDIPKGRQERMGSYGHDTAVKSPFSSSLYQRSTSSSPSNDPTKTPPRRSSSLSRMSQWTATETKKGETSRTAPMTSSSPGTDTVFDRKTRASSHSGEAVKKTESETSYLRQHSSDARKDQTSRTDQRSSAVPDTDSILDKKMRSSGNLGEAAKKSDFENSCLSKYTSSGTSTGTKPKSERDIMARTTPSFKHSLMTSTAADYKIKGTKKAGDTESPTGKVRARRGWDEDEGNNTDEHTSGLTRTSAMPPRGRNTAELGLHSLPINLEQNVRGAVSPLKSDEEEKCAICLDTCRRPKTLQTCKHTFCTKCIDEYFKKAKPICPVCGTIYGKLRGTQPKDGIMVDGLKHNVFLPGYETADGAIVIKYQFPSGVQKSNHPNPGKPYKGIQRTAYLPNNQEGRQVWSLLKKAFDARLVFTVGDSRTTGKEGVLTWNDVHHKTNIFGGPENFGYPDPTYLTRVKQELADKGITTV